MPDHPKIVGLTAVAFRAHVEGLCYCAKHLTDGFVPAPAAAKLAKKPVLNELVKAQLWIPKRGGFWVKNYLEYNPSKEKVELGRAQRSQKARAAADARWHATSNAPSIDSVDAPIPIPSHPIPKYGHSHTAPSGNGNDHTHTNDLRVRAEDLDPAIVGEIERLVRCIPNGEKSMGRLVKAARDGKPQAAFSDARAAYENTRSHKRNPGAYVCGLVEKYA